MYCDESRRKHWPAIETELITVCQEALEYFLQLQSEGHRDSWTSLLLLVMTRLLKMPDDRVRKHFKFAQKQKSENNSFCLQFAVHVSRYYPLLCEIVCFDLKAELRSILRRVFLRIGPVFHITSTQLKYRIKEYQCVYIGIPQCVRFQQRYNRHYNESLYCFVAEGLLWSFEFVG